MKYIYLLLAIILFSAFCLTRVPMTENFKDSSMYRWLHKKVYEKKTLDDMESLDHWTSFTSSGVAMVDARKVIVTPDSNSSVAEISLTGDVVHEGKRSLEMTTPTRLAGDPPKNGRHWGRAGLRRVFDGEDWTAYNRISIWIYPDLPGFYTTALDAQLYNNGKTKLPAIFAQEGQTSWNLKNRQWNHIVWEINNVARDKITAFEMSYGLSGNYPEEANKIHFYFDQLELEKVDADKTEGWDVAANKIAYTHTGYQTGAEKTAIASNLSAKIFQLTDAQTGKTVFSGLVRPTRTHLGAFGVMDFSDFRTAGTYILKAGSLSTRPFRIGDDIYDRTIWKALNFFYSERCGAEVPGIHGVEHQDWTCVHGDKSIVINGGWHDAGDLTQGVENTSEITYGLFGLAEKLKRRGGDPALYNRVLEEAEWGLHWILKTSFGDGYRNVGSINSRRTDNIIGDDDDIVATAKNSPLANFEAANAEAIAYRVLKDEDPRLANYALKMAKADWQFAVAGMQAYKPSAEMFRATFDSDNVEDELPAQAILTSVNLWRATGDNKYKTKAVELAPIITGAQQRSRPDWDTPLTGFFYTSTAKDRILHYCHRGREQGPTLALTALCDAFPDDNDWMNWYSTVTLYSEYLKTIAEYTKPYSVMPASVYADTEYMHAPESRRESFRKQVLNGIALGKGHYLRIFPVWMDYRGHFGTILPQAQALASAARLRGDLASAQLSVHQLEWIVGRNPFSESTMYGEGYDYVPLYSPSSGDMVGGLPVGIQTKDEDDAPYWPVQAMWTYKEIWVHPVSRWVWLLDDVGGLAMVTGKAGGKVTFKAEGSSQAVTVDPDHSGHYKVMLPQGRYTVTCDGNSCLKTFLPGSDYTLDFDDAHYLDYTISAQTSPDGKVIIRLNAKGTGTHQLTIRTDNLTLTNPVKTIRPGKNTPVSVEWQARITSANTPWVAVVIPDGNINDRKEVRGAAWEK
ncbi:MAG TPA: glycoside hydrolase family 9 protein [Mucilaginibacter sp.]|nr:glycoside hydrolase family 9 protein [Mucilaginibacter sp.]